MSENESSILGGVATPEPVAVATPDAIPATTPAVTPAVEPITTPTVPDISVSPTEGIPNPNNSWTDSLNDDGRSYMEKKGYKSTQDLADGYMHLSKHLGGDSGDLFVFKEGEQAPDGLHARLGVPDSADLYSFTEVEGFDGGDRLNAMKTVAKEHNVSGSAFKAIVDGFVAGEMAENKRVQDAFVEKTSAEVADMKLEMGVEFDKFINQADSAIRALNKNGVVISNELRDSFTASVGPKASVQFFSEIFKHLGEDTITNTLGEMPHGETIESCDKGIADIIAQMGSSKELQKEFYAHGAIKERYDKLQATRDRINAGK